MVIENKKTIFECSECGKEYSSKRQATECEKDDMYEEKTKQIERTVVFTITENHLNLLKRLNVEWYDCEFGAPCIDPKRPYGNSNVESDIYEMTKMKGDKALFIHKEMQIVLQIIFATGLIETGDYEKQDQYDYQSWQKMTN